LSSRQQSDARHRREGGQWSTASVRRRSSTRRRGRVELEQQPDDRHRRRARSRGGQGSCRRHRSGRTGRAVAVVRGTGAARQSWRRRHRRGVITGRLHLHHCLRLGGRAGRSTSWRARRRRSRAPAAWSSIGRDGSGTRRRPGAAAGRGRGRCGQDRSGLLSIRLEGKKKSEKTVIGIEWGNGATRVMSNDSRVSQKKRLCGVLFCRSLFSTVSKSQISLG
jgi:hypothetical protein